MALTEAQDAIVFYFSLFVRLLHSTEFLTQSDLQCLYYLFQTFLSENPKKNALDP